MPPSGFKTVTVSEEAYEQAKQLKKLGLEESIGKAFANAMSEYMRKREDVINELLSVISRYQPKANEGVDIPGSKVNG